MLFTEPPGQGLHQPNTKSFQLNHGGETMLLDKGDSDQTAQMCSLIAAFFVPTFDDKHILLISYLYVHLQLTLFDLFHYS